MSTYETLIFALENNIATITLNRPERLNAAPVEMADEIRDACEEAINGGARCIVMTGAGRAFCSGADLASSGNKKGLGGVGAREALRTSYNPMMTMLAELPVPLVCAVNGPAAGVGCSMALAGDFVFAAESAYFLQAFVNIGLVPDGGASWMLPRLIGKPRAMEMMMLGEKIRADKAADWGMVYKTVADDALMDEAMALAERLAKGPTLALGLMRKMTAQNLDNSYARAMDVEADAQYQAGNSDDARIGAISFLKKEKPQFTGK